MALRVLVTVVAAVWAATLFSLPASSLDGASTRSSSRR